jgi:hypothetical protein
MAEKLELEIEKILEVEVEYLKKTGVPSSSAFFLASKGRYMVDPFDFRDKRKAKKLLKKIAKKQKATMVITMAGALISQFEGSPSDPPYFRREVVFVYGETKTGSFGISQEFECDKNGQIVFGKRMVWPNGTTGPMTGFMCRAYR